MALAAISCGSLSASQPSTLYSFIIAKYCPSPSSSATAASASSVNPSAVKAVGDPAPTPRADTPAGFGARPTRTRPTVNVQPVAPAPVNIPRSDTQDVLVPVSEQKTVTAPASDVVINEEAAADEEARARKDARKSKAESEAAFRKAEQERKKRILAREKKAHEAAAE